MHLVVNTSPTLLILDDDLDFAGTVKRRYDRRGYEAYLWSELSEIEGKPLDILLFKHSISSEARIKSWLQSRSCLQEIEIIALAYEDTMHRAAEFVPQFVTVLQRLPINWLELDWRLRNACQRRQRQQGSKPSHSRSSSLSLLLATESSHPVERVHIDKSSSPATDVTTLEELQRSHVLSILKREKWNKAKTARALGVNRRSLYRLMERFGLKQGSPV